jgi:predicted ATP-dependent endonuclease of OLD family
MDKEHKDIFLKEVHVRNYRSLQDASISFKRGLNILIGKNGAGKSNLLSFLDRILSGGKFFSPTVLKNTNIFFEYSTEFKKNNKKNEILISFSSEPSISAKVKFTKKISSKAIYSHELLSSQKIPAKYEKELDKDHLIIESLKFKYLQFEMPNDLAWLKDPSKINIAQGSVTSDSLYNFEFSFVFSFEDKLTSKLSRYVYESKSNLINTDIKEIILNFFSEYINKVNLNLILAKYSPISEIRLGTNMNFYSGSNRMSIENLIFEFKLNNEWISWSFLSDGTKRMFYLITEILYFEDDILLIEEPELGIHPHQLHKLMDFIKEQSAKKQIIISTHSPTVLDALEPNELDRIQIAQMTDKGTKFKKLTKAQIAKAKEYIEKVGELSYYWLHSDLEND